VDIHKEICCRAVWRWVILESKLGGCNEKKVEYHMRKGGGLSEEMTVLSGVVYKAKSRGPRTQP